MTSIEITNVKQFMHSLLCTEAFDSFLLCEAHITTIAEYHIDGRRSAEGDGTVPSYRLLRPVCYQMVRGTKAPSRMHFVFQLSPENQARTIEKSNTPFTNQDIGGLFLNVLFQNEKLVLTTGISYKTFSLDKSLEQEWDRLVPLFLKNKGIQLPG